MKKECCFPTSEIIVMCALFMFLGVLIGMIIGKKMITSEEDRCFENLEKATVQIEHCVDSYEKAVELNTHLLEIVTYRACGNE